MTKAICFHCGHFKTGSFLPCDECHTKPQTDDELIVSIAMSDNFFDQPTLEAMVEYIKENGHHPQLDPESEKVFRKKFEEAKATGVLDKLFENPEN